MAKRAALKAQVGALFRQAVDQLDDVRQVVRRRGDRIEADIRRLMQERDRLMVLLGEQTYKLANQGKVPLPSFVQRTVERLNEVVTSLAPQMASKPTSGHVSHSEGELNGHAAPAKKRPASKKTRTSKKARSSVSKSTN